MGGCYSLPSTLTKGPYESSHDDEKKGQTSSTGAKEMIVMWNEDMTQVEVKASPAGGRRLSRNNKLKSRAMPYSMKIQFKSAHEQIVEEEDEESLRRTSSRKMSHVEKIKNRKMQHAKVTGEK